MSRALFRQEAVDFKQDKLFGDILEANPLSFSLLAVWAVAMAGLLIAFIVWGEYTRKTHVSGYLSPSKGLIKVHTPQAGTIIDKQVSEGQFVRQGERLFVISTERGSRETPEAQAAGIAKLRERRDALQREHSKQGEIDHIHTRSLQDRVHNIQAELGQIRLEIGTQAQKVASADNVVQRYRQLLTKNYVSEVGTQEKLQQLLDQQGRLQGLRRNQLSLERELHDLTLELSSSGLKAENQRSATEREIAQLEQQLTELESRRTIVVTAPSDGTATAILAEQGQTATTDHPLMSLLPAGAELEAHLLTPSRAAGFISPGQTVAVRYQAFPYQRFGSYGGRIKEISKTLITPGEANLPVSLKEPVYRVTVSLDRQSVMAYQNALPLQSGMLLDADIWLDHRRIIEWLFDPLYSLKGRL